MKILNVFVAALAISLSSCNNQGNQDAVSQQENNHADGHHEGHPPRDGDHKGPPGHGDGKGHPPHGDRKGPPRGGLPEQTETLEETGGYLIGDVATDFSLKM